jgi:hypothetical protein
MKALKISQHGAARARQRGVRHRDVHFICEFGTRTERGFVLTDADIRELEAEALEVLRKARKLRGVLAAVQEDIVTTVFRLNRVQKRHIVPTNN